VAVVDTYRFGVIAKSKQKTDKADARALARFLKLGWLPEVAVPSEQVRTLAAALAGERDAGGDADEAQEHGARGLLP
jgi:transposase